MGKGPLDTCRVYSIIYGRYAKNDIFNAIRSHYFISDCTPQRTKGKLLYPLIYYVNHNLFFMFSLCETRQ